MGLLNIIYEKPKAMIGTVTIDAAVSVKHSIASTPTRNPVEEGAKVTDHVELEPQAISIQGVISDTPLDFNILNSIAKGDLKSIGNTFKDGAKSMLSKASRSIEQYQSIMQIWKSREPIKVITGFKVYENMIITRFEVDQTATTGQAMHFSADLEEIRIVSSKSVGKESFAKGIKDLASKKKNLGTQVAETLDPVKDQKKFSGATFNFAAIAVGSFF